MRYDPLNPGGIVPITDGPKPPVVPAYRTTPKRNPPVKPPVKLTGPAAVIAALPDAMLSYLSAQLNPRPANADLRRRLTDQAIARNLADWRTAWNEIKLGYETPCAPPLPRAIGNSQLVTRKSKAPCSERVPPKPPVPAGDNHSVEPAWRRRLAAASALPTAAPPPLPPATPPPPPPLDGDDDSNPFGEVIYGYSRAQAIVDGVLVDLMRSVGPDWTEDTARLVREAGFKYPVAMTAGAWAEAVCRDGEELKNGQSIIGRLWDVLYLLHLRAKGNSTDRIHFQVKVRNRLVRLWSLIGPGDTAAPVLTIMLEGED